MWLQSLRWLVRRKVVYTCTYMMNSLTQRRHLICIVLNSFNTDTHVLLHSSGHVICKFGDLNYSKCPTFLLILICYQHWKWLRGEFFLFNRIIFFPLLCCVWLEINIKHVLIKTLDLLNHCKRIDFFVLSTYLFCPQKHTRWTSSSISIF